MFYRVAWLVPALMAASLIGCSWVKLTPEGERVRVLKSEEVGGCKKLGTTSATLMSKVAWVKREEDKVERELADLARNSAAEMGGDSVVPISAITEGRRTFAVYKCVGVTPAAEQHLPPPPAEERLPPPGW